MKSLVPNSGADHARVSYTAGGVRFRPEVFSSPVDHVIVELDLGGTGSMQRPTDERIAHFAQGNDPQLAALYFQFGRYLLISSSRPGSQPANLQGIWNIIVMFRIFTGSSPARRLTFAERRSLPPRPGSPWRSEETRRRLGHCLAAEPLDTLA